MIKKALRVAARHFSGALEGLIESIEKSDCNVLAIVGADELLSFKLVQEML